MKNNRTIVYIAGFLFSVPIALTSYINSSFLEQYMGSNYVGGIYILASLATIFSLINMPRFMQSIGNRKTALSLSAGLTLSLFAMGSGGGAFFSILAFVVSFVFSNLLVISLDVFVEDYTRGKSIGSARGIYITLTSLAWVLSQQISGSIINKSSFSGIYIFSSLFMVLVTFIFGFFLHGFKDPKYTKVALKKTVVTFIKTQNLRQAYLVNFVLKFFYVWMVIYTPIYLHDHIGFDWGQIGFIFSIMLLPFVILSTPLGKLSDRIGEKKMLVYGFLINIFSVLLIPFIKSPNVYIWILVLFTTRVGAATIEVMDESYFFKIIKEEDADEVSFFRNTQSLAYLLAPALAIPIFFLTPSFEYLFFALVVIMLAGLLISLRIKDVR